MSEYDGYGWIKVPRYRIDESKTWEERYLELDRHHIQETTFLIEKVRELARRLEENRLFAEDLPRPVMQITEATESKGCQNIPTQEELDSMARGERPPTPGGSGRGDIRVLSGFNIGLEPTDRK